MSTRPPSGQQLRLQHGDTEAVIVEVGGGLRTFDVAGVPVLDGYAEDEACSAGRGQVLAPWPNRLGDGRYEFQGTSGRLPVNDFGTGCASHGLSRWARWTLTSAGAASAVATFPLPPQPGWPFSLEFSVAYTLRAGALDVATTATNTGSVTAPVGLGHHPYLRVPVDTATVELPAATRLLMNDRQLPTGETEPATRLFEPVGDRRLDDCLTDLQVNRGGRWEVVVASAEPGVASRVTLWGDQTWPYLQVFSGDTVPQPERRRQGLAIEPMTCPPNALASGEGLIALAPGESVTGHWGIEVG
jgi:aldose 1-epimerase